MGDRITRRGVLKTGIAAGALMGAGAWRATAANAAPLQQPGSLPYPKLPAGTDTIPQIEHIVVLMMENHSYDNYLGMLQRDHTSILKLIETKWNLPALTYRDANATAMLDMLDLHKPSFATPPVLAEPLAVTDPSALTCSTTGPGTIPPPGSVTG